ncbi:hypothetical protein BDV26DRAFT_174756 [Aspergillus bertholletiae]|uniref:Uncharacterized protein n=1 Tax=Aspergillus bertholletiae TaxID=1226010 RepID=A0A5N7BBJ5_9EURO|nr:hypothetical protein BDV26DRAFT_174756 [Aspergillus bertholletiae]
MDKTAPSSDCNLTPAGLGYDYTKDRSPKNPTVERGLGHPPSAEVSLKVSALHVFHFPFPCQRKHNKGQEESNR